MKKRFEQIRNTNTQYMSYLGVAIEHSKNKKRLPVKYWVALKYWALRRWFTTVRNIVVIVQVHDMAITQLNQQLDFLTTNSNRAMKRKWARTVNEVKNETIQ